MAYQLMKLNAEDNTWAPHGVVISSYFVAEAEAHEAETDGEVYAILHIETGVYV